MIKVLPPKTAEEVMAREKERKTRTTFLMALPEDHLAKFHKMAYAKEMFQTLLSQLEIHGAGVSQEDANQKFLRSLPFSWSQEALIMRTKPGLDTLSFDDLNNNLRVIERDVKGPTASSSNTQNVAFVSADNTSSTNDVSTAYSVSSPSVSKLQKEGSSSYNDEVIHSFFSNQSSAPQLDYNDLEQINDDDIEEMDLKWQGHFARDCRAKGNQDSRRKDVRKSDSGFLIGYSLNSKALRVYNSKTKRVEENLHVNFLDNKPNVTGKRHAWMFDLDYQTNSMNYEPVSVENQANKSAGPKEANNSVGTQANDDQAANSKEIDLHEEHFVLPIWFAYSTTVKSSGDKIEKNTDFKSREKPNANTSSTNLLNIVSTPLSVAGLSIGFNYGEPSYPDDPLMPHLKGIYASPREGIFTNSSYDNEGVVTDFNNLETTISVSPTPTTRTHTIHPKTQILRDHMSDVQTRSKVNKNSEARALSAFVYGTINEEVYVSQPHGFVDPKFPNKKSWCDEFEELMKNMFQMSSMGELTFFLRLQVKQKEDGNPQQEVVKFLAGDLSYGNAKSRLFGYFYYKGKDQIMDFLNAHIIQYALVVNPTIYVSCIKQFWATATIKKVNDAVQLRALINKKKIVVTEDVVRSDLHLDDADGVKCLPNEEIFSELARTGYEKLPPKLTFYKAFFSAQWKFLVHALVQCLSAKMTAWNEFSCSMASAVICLARGRKINFSKYIFDSMVRNVDNPSKFLMYPRFLQVIINNQVDDLTDHNTKYTSPALTQKVFMNMRRVGKGFLGVETPLFASMLVQPQPQDEEVEKEDEIPNASSLPPQDLPLHPVYCCWCSGGYIQIEGKIKAIDVDEDVTLVDVETQVDMDAELRGRIDQEVSAATKEVSAAEPTVFDDEEVTMTIAQTLIKMKAEKAKLLDEQMAQRLHDEEVEKAAAREKQEKDDLERAQVLQKHYDDKQGQ
nr:hypothetical protein [Tanacetum cinerariifolium]